LFSPDPGKGSGEDSRAAALFAILFLQEQNSFAACRLAGMAKPLYGTDTIFFLPVIQKG
jgi:hypothetical protein